ncbi:MAG: RNA 2',3'-cyclic phosphodiesterase [Candidatus Aenigmatarchaeota archaeon]
MRTFIAIEIPAELKQKIVAIQKKIAETGADIKLVEPENLHYNLKFLGEIDQKTAEKVKNALSNVSFPAFDIHISCLGTFPSLSHIRVVWLGVKEGSQQLAALAATVEEALAGIGIAREQRPFTPHLTLGRVTSAKAKDALVATIKDLQTTDIGIARIDKMVFFESKLTPKGPIYTPLHVVELK